MRISGMCVPMLSFPNMLQALPAISVMWTLLMKLAVSMSGAGRAASGISFPRPIFHLQDHIRDHIHPTEGNCRPFCPSWHTTGRYQAYTDGFIQTLALMIQSQVSGVFHVDIHPAAQVGRGVLLDHATGVVIGETAVVGDNVSMLHHVTLGGSGTGSGIRHPHIGEAGDACSCLMWPTSIKLGANMSSMYPLLPPSCSRFLHPQPTSTEQSAKDKKPSLERNSLFTRELGFLVEGALTRFNP